MIFTGTHSSIRVRIKNEKTAAIGMIMKNSAQEMNTPMIMTGKAPMILVPLSTIAS